MTIDGISGKDTGVVSFGAPEHSGGEGSESEQSGVTPNAAALQTGFGPEPEVLCRSSGAPAATFRSGLQRPHCQGGEYVPRRGHFWHEPRCRIVQFGEIRRRIEIHAPRGMGAVVSSNCLALRCLGYVGQEVRHRF